ncbi:V-type ATP synthase subunit E [Halalkalicoccus jeotgali]|uniref:A-type ATP synthase subunit E n=1 Tax=Halalkalicoccus jeotgali (strain DSM 18796 / CECT 7217 / JCM 14584 / KCTC 4019 / B3) TaxID=795797 RepID=D8J5W7_HALJB|nr:V-type ATP synthase subunit E [Halalkalicoccus jeotgali]ADJ13773.1 V-type ATP synthase subunit E [Halalkalicoccus jeotgali B3]ELY34181.1 V-type ATP synthase subunit E [Halalkalicoccus jeotgali B3]
MSLETVAEDIREEARARAREIEADAEERAEAIVAEAEADAAEIEAEREREVEREIAQEREQRLSSANLQAKQKRLEARRDVLEDVRERVEAEIAGIEGERREELTDELLAAAAEEFDEDASVEIYGRADDEAMIAALLESYDGYEFAGEYDCLGGVVAESEASRVRVNNTFDSVLEDVWEDNLKEASTRLFEQ